jgi:transcriptional regulator with XRE-family HTH domain
VPKKTENLAGNVRKLREEAGLTQEQLAERSSIANATVSRIERGRINPSTSLIAKLSAALHVSVDDLLGRPKTSKPVFRSSIAKLVGAVEGLDDGAVDDVTRAIKLILAAGKRTGRPR